MAEDKYAYEHVPQRVWYVGNVMIDTLLANRSPLIINRYPMYNKILTYESIDRTEWSTLVRESETGTWFQTPEAYAFFASMPELFTPFAIGVASPQPSPERKGVLRAVCVGYVTREKNTLKQFFTRRAIIMGGPCLADDCTDVEVEELMKAVQKELKSDAIFIESRNFNDYSGWKGAFAAAGFDYKPHLNFHVDCTDKERVWERLSDNRKRQIRKISGASEGLGAGGQKQTDERDICEWYEILSELYRTKVKTPLWPVEFFLQAHRKGVGTFLFVRHEGKIIGGSMIVTDGTCAYEWFECGLNNIYKEQYPSVMATYAGILYAAEKGCKRYDMMGAGEPGVPYGVRDFKAEFGGEQVEHGRYLCIVKPLLYRIGKMGVVTLKNTHYTFNLTQYK